MEIQENKLAVAPSQLSKKALAKKKSKLKTAIEKIQLKKQKQNQTISVGLIPVPTLDEVEDTVVQGEKYTAQEKIDSIKRINAQRVRKFKIRAAGDVVRSCVTYILSFITLIVLVGIIIYCFATGWDTFSWDFISGNYYSQTYNIKAPSDLSVPEGENYEEPSLGEDEYFSPRWGVSFVDSTATDGQDEIVISYVATDSPFTKLIATNGVALDIANGWSISSLSYQPEGGRLQVISTRDGAKGAIEKLEKFDSISSGTITSGGFGIRGPLIATLYMILFSLIIALPLGIGGAVYLSYYAKRGTLTKIIQSLIDMISGVPSIIFGLAGAVIFIPIFSGGNGAGTILSGAATLACMVLPTIMKSTQEAIRSIPKSLKNASLALGASQTQTVFKVIIPNSVPGILTGTLLAIGRIIGESAALVFATGTYISDTPTPTSQAASLAVYIWKVMSGEAPNYKAAAAAAILILIVVLILNIAVKLLAAKFNKFKPVGPKPWYKKLYEKEKKKRADRKAVQQAIMGQTDTPVKGETK